MMKRLLIVIALCCYAITPVNPSPPPSLSLFPSPSQPHNSTTYPPPVTLVPNMVDSKKNGECPEKINEVASHRCAFELFDANFFNDKKILEIVKGVKELNIPIIRANRKLVASVNGGLHNPSALVFNPEWSREQPQSIGKRFHYPSLIGTKRPKNEEDIAFMSVLELGELIKTKQITSEELTRIFLQRLKRYNHVLEAVVSYTEELAYKQAKHADELLARGVYLGPLHGIPYGLMTSGMAVGQGTHGTLRNLQRVHQLGLLHAHQLVWSHLQLVQKRLAQSRIRLLVVV